jgi:hypothetical protein
MIEVDDGAQKDGGEVVPVSGLKFPPLAVGAGVRRMARSWAANDAGDLGFEARDEAAAQQTRDASVVEGNGVYLRGRVGERAARHGLRRSTGVHIGKGPVRAARLGLADCAWTAGSKARRDGIVHANRQHIKTHKRMRKAERLQCAVSLSPSPFVAAQGARKAAKAEWPPPQPCAR